MASTALNRITWDLERRRSPRASARLPFELYAGGRSIGRFWSGNVSQEGLFLETTSPDALASGILGLRFEAGGSDHDLRGRVVYRVPGEGIGIQLAYWRSGDRLAHQAYLRAIA
jgi:hypothetical protein